MQVRMQDAGPGSDAVNACGGVCPPQTKKNQQVGSRLGGAAEPGPPMPHARRAALRLPAAPCACPEAACQATCAVRCLSGHLRRALPVRPLAPCASSQATCAVRLPLRPLAPCAASQATCAVRLPLRPLAPCACLSGHLRRAPASQATCAVRCLSSASCSIRRISCFKTLPSCPDNCPVALTPVGPLQLPCLKPQPQPITVRWGSPLHVKHSACLGTAPGNASQRPCTSCTKQRLSRISGVSLANIYASAATAWLTRLSMTRLSMNRHDSTQHESA
jgi:hypothetical protein